MQLTHYEELALRAEQLEQVIKVTDDEGIRNSLKADYQKILRADIIIPLAFDEFEVYEDAVDTVGGAYYDLLESAHNKVGDNFQVKLAILL